VKEILARYDKASEVFWGQEEPINMGSWDFTEPKLHKLLEGRIPVQYAGRKPSASTATGVNQLHLRELETFVDESLGLGT
jgi:2-oxoglutarate dehydrogenase complex dehydrogenase (E1) component-like enzyme